MPVNADAVQAMAQRMARDRARRRAELDAQRRADDTALLNPLAVAAVVGALNDLTPADPGPSDFTGGGGDFGGGGASGDF